VNIQPVRKRIQSVLAGAMMTTSTAFALGVGSCALDQVANGPGSVGAPAAMIQALGGDSEGSDPTRGLGRFLGSPLLNGGVFSGDPDAGPPLKPGDLFSGDGDVSDPSRLPRIPRF
jgi:hypothetical protein